MPARVGRSYPAPQVLARPALGGRRHVSPGQVHRYERGTPTGSGPGRQVGPPGPLPGFEPGGYSGSGTWGIDESDRARALQSWAAMKRRIALAAGPTADRWSSYPGDGLTPELIVQCRKEAHAGYPWRWADLCEQLLERNYALKSFGHFRRAWIHGVPWRLDPAEHFKDDTLSKDLCLFLTAVLNGLRPCWRNVMHNLLSATAYGYAAAEIFWDYRTITFKRSNGDEVSIPDCWVPVWMEPVHQKHFTFQLYTDEALIWAGQGKPGARWAKGKMLFHRAVGDGIACRRGYMTAAAWIEYAMQAGWRDLLIWMHLYGINQFALVIDENILEQEEQWALLQEGVTNYGQGQIPIWPEGAEVKELGSVGGQHPIHPDVIKMGEQMLSLVIVGSLLAQTQGDGTGSYGASSEHATSAHVFRLPDGGQLETDTEKDMLQPCVEFNVDQLADAFRVGPDQVRARMGALQFGWKAIDKAPTVDQVIDHAVKLHSINFPVDMAEISQRSGYSLGSKQTALPSEPVIIPQGAKAVGSAEADGVLGQPKPAPQRPAQETSR